VGEKKQRVKTSDTFPNFLHEKDIMSQGISCVAGVDEVGAGCLAGPVVAAAVILNADCIPEGIHDSKKLSVQQREKLEKLIHSQSVAYAIGVASVEEIDQINIFHAAKLAMKRAVELLSIKPDHLLIDGKFPIPISISQQCIVKGDSKSLSIAAASIIAKVHRDREMALWDEKIPGYGFAQHKGYGTISHRQALQKLGPTFLHRKTFHWTEVPIDS